LDCDIVDWVNRLETLGRALRNGQIRALAWQEGMNDLYHHVSINALLRCIDFQKIIDGPGFACDDQQTKFVGVQFRSDQGIPENRVVRTKIAKIKKGCSILPHGPLNMVSAFLTLSGEFHVTSGIVKLSEFDRKLGNTRIHHSLIVPQSGYWPEAENQPNLT